MKSTKNRDIEIAKRDQYESFLDDLKSQIIASQSKALIAINKELMQLYWNIGKSIVEKQKIHGWGDSIIKGFANDLQIAFPGIRGFPSKNLWKMHDVYVSYVDIVFLQPLVAERLTTKLEEILTTKLEEILTTKLEVSK